MGPEQEPTVHDKLMNPEKDNCLLNQSARISFSVLALVPKPRSVFGSDNLMHLLAQEICKFIIHCY